MNVQNFRYMPERTNFEIYCLRWSECVNDMQMTHAAAYVFVNNYFPESTENAVSLHLHVEKKMILKTRHYTESVNINKLNFAG